MDCNREVKIPRRLSSARLLNGPRVYRRTSRAVYNYIYRGSLAPERLLAESEIEIAREGGREDCSSARIRSWGENYCASVVSARIPRVSLALAEENNYIPCPWRDAE